MKQETNDCPDDNSVAGKQVLEGLVQGVDTDRADPRGDGSGDAGWLLPDEITRRPFRRGALGMPKGVKDTGGCQLFAMHCYAPHLDGRYTAFGEAVDGLDVIDRIRVGDLIASVRVQESVAEAPRGK